MRSNQPDQTIRMLYFSYSPISLYPIALYIYLLYRLGWLGRLEKPLGQLVFQPLANLKTNTKVRLQSPLMTSSPRGEPDV